MSTAVVTIVVAALMLGALLGLRLVRRRALRSTQSTTLLAEEMRLINVALERNNQRTRRLQALTASLLRALTPEQVAEAACREGAAAAGAEAAIMAQDPDGEATPELLTVAGCTAAEAGDVLAGSVGDAAREARRDGWARTIRDGASTWVWHALRFRDRPLGVLGMRYAGGGPSEQSGAFVESVVQQCAQALERARLYEAERAARVRAEFAERRLAFLASASVRLGESLELDRTLGGVADLVVSNVADLCVIHVRDESDATRVVAASEARDGHLIRGADVTASYDVSPESRNGWPAVLHTGRAELLPAIDEAVIEGLGVDPERQGRLRRLGLSSQVAVPIRARDAVIGVLTIAATEATRPLTQAELQLAEQLAVRLGQAIDRTRLYRSAVEASQAKSDFLAVISHELKTPLNAIIGFTDLMIAGIPAPIPEAALHQAKRVRGAAVQLLRLVDDLLAYARAEADQERVRLSAFPLDDVVAEAVGMALPLAAEKGIEVRYSAETGAILQSDAGKVGQILNNLISNAIKFTEQGLVRIDAEVEAGNAKVRVHDSGIGIDAEHLAHIFDPFWQVEQTTVRRYGGAGIGLGVVRRLSRQLGGDVRVDSEPGRGSTFELTLPLRFEPKAAAAPAP